MLEASCLTIFLVCVAKATKGISYRDGKGGKAGFISKMPLMRNRASTLWMEVYCQS